jgi:hypothetical protein
MEADRSPVAGWCVHFVVTSSQVPIGPWLLFESSEEVKTKMFHWGTATDEEMKQYEIDLRHWGHAGVHILLSDRQLRTLAERARGWPWNGYELIQMGKAGKYPPQRLAPPPRAAPEVPDKPAKKIAKASLACRKMTLYPDR